MWRQALLIVATVLFSLSPARSFAFEGTLEGKINGLSAGVETSAPPALPIPSIHTLSSTEGIPDQGNEGPEDLQAPLDSEPPGEFPKSGNKRPEPEQRLRFAGPLPTLPALPSISLDDFLGRVEKYNLDLAAQQLNTPILEGQAAAARVYPDPVVGGIYGGDISHHKQPTAWGAGVSQTILLGGKIGARTAVANSAVRQSDAQLANFLRNLRADAAREFADTLTQSLVVRFHYQALRRAEHLIHPGIGSRFAAKNLHVNLLRSHLAVLDERDALLTAQSSLRQKLFHLALLMGRDDQLAYPRGNLDLAPRHFVRDELIAHALASRGDIETARQAVEGAKAQLQLVKANRWPDLTVQGNYAHFTQSTNLVDPSPAWDGAFVALSMPLPLSNLNRGELEAVHNSNLQMARVLHAAQLRAEMEIRESFERYSLAVDRVEEYSQEILRDAEEVYAARKQEGATGSLLEILDAQRTYNEVYIDYFKALREQAQALIDLERDANIWDIHL